MKNQPYIEAQQLNSEAIEILMIFIPNEDRNKKNGTKLYQQWESQLPKNTKYIQLFAADTNGNGNSDHFWESLGFDWKYDIEDESDIDYIGYHTMWKGVNGYNTPEKIKIEQTPSEC